jgi:hypothetical protein
MRRSRLHAKNQALLWQINVNCSRPSDFAFRNQTALADALGVTFQQVLSHVLQVPIPLFFEGLPNTQIKRRNLRRSIVDLVQGLAADKVIVTRSSP